MNPLKIAAENVASVYSGTAGLCCCGCAGRHRYATRFVAEAAKSRGYEITPDEISDRSVAIIINKIKKNANSIRLEDVSTGHVSVQVGGRLYIAYLANDAQK